MQEIWKDIVGYEEFYQVSNFGNIRSKDRYKRNNAGVMLLKGRMLKPSPNSKGYLRIKLNDNKSKRAFFIHRLVALHFVDNPAPDTNNVVNHLDSNYLNNNANNLEWTTMRGNTRHAISKGRMRRTNEWLRHLRETNEKKGAAVVGVNLKTNERIYFTCLNDCKAKGFQPSCVCNCCKGIRKTHKGFVWRYATQNEIGEGA